ncbi:sulfotransferase [Nostoc sp.]|uniref:sulfotransferase n=1 Tax=Nostoc sp. TaxID=1180 RepID=UPI003FA5527F
MIPKIHFISGLPRSGSTLLGALLRQNPRFHASMSSRYIKLIQSYPNKSLIRKFTNIFSEHQI